jgi:hypothetical protein
VRESEEMIWDMVRERRRRSGERSIMILIYSEDL